MNTTPNPQPTNCTKCDQPHPRCRAHNTQNQPCMRWPKKGDPVCKKHGAAAPQTAAAFERRRVEAQVRATSASWSLPPVTNPLEALAALAGEHVGWRNKLAEMVDDLQGKLTLSGFDKFDAEYEQARAVVDLYVRALDAERRVLADIGRLKVDERLAEIEDRKIDVIVEVLDRVFDDVGLEGDQRSRARESFARHIRQLPAA